MTIELLRKMLYAALSVLNDYERGKSTNINLDGAPTTTAPTDFVDLDKVIVEPPAKPTAPPAPASGLDIDALLSNFKK